MTGGAALKRIGIVIAAFTILGAAAGAYFLVVSRPRAIVIEDINLGTAKGRIEAWAAQGSHLVVVLYDKDAGESSVWQTEGNELKPVQLSRRERLVGSRIALLRQPQAVYAAVGWPVEAFFEIKDGVVTKLQDLVPWAIYELKIVNCPKLDVPLFAAKVEGKSAALLYAGDGQLRCSLDASGEPILDEFEGSTFLGGVFENVLRSFPDGRTLMARKTSKTATDYWFDGRKLTPVAPVAFPNGETPDNWAEVGQFLAPNAEIRIARNKTTRQVQAWIVESGKARWISGEDGKPLSASLMTPRWFESSFYFVANEKDAETGQTRGCVFRVKGTTAIEVKWHDIVQPGELAINEEDGALFVTRHRKFGEGSAWALFRVLPDGVHPVKHADGRPVHVFIFALSTVVGGLRVIGYINPDALDTGTEERRMGLLDGLTVIPIQLPADVSPLSDLFEVGGMALLRWSIIGHDKSRSQLVKLSAGGQLTSLTDAAGKPVEAEQMEVESNVSDLFLLCGQAFDAPTRIQRVAFK